MHSDENLAQPKILYIYIYTSMKENKIYLLICTLFQNTEKGKQSHVFITKLAKHLARLSKYKINNNKLIYMYFFNFGHTTRQVVS